MTAVAFIVSRRPDGGRRDQLWEFARAWWPRMGFEWPIVVAEDKPSDGPFCRGRLLNEAAANAGSPDVYVIIDADVVVDPRQLRAAVDRAVETGRLVFPFTRYVPLNETATDRVLDGYDGNWERAGVDRRTKMMSDHVSSVIVVPRVLWEKVGGFDERFVGWGCEDRAFEIACEIEGGAVERIAGDVHHLWHPWSAERDTRSPLYLMGHQLYRSYCSATTPDDLAAIRHPNVTDGIVVVVVTHGRKSRPIGRCIASLEANVSGPIRRRIISDDSGSAAYRRWLVASFPGWEVVGPSTQGGFGRHYARIWAQVSRIGLGWLFSVEDDFTFEQPVDLADMQRVMDENLHIGQIALRRQPWFTKEKEAGGIIEMDPTAYTQRENDRGERWIEHRKFWTTNPSLQRTSWCAGWPWPMQRGSEITQTRRIFRSRPELVSAFWGSIDDAPWVLHEGERSGVGY